jgi:hypothetical protein
MEQSSEKPPIVFVSYSHEGASHQKRVLSLAARLRKEGGCDSHLDRYEVGVANWPRWMMREIKAADYVLMVFTPTYERRFLGEEKAGRGRGVTWEGTIITNQLYAAAAANELKFIPVVFSTTDSKWVPREVFSGSVYVLFDEWRPLLRRLWRKPSVLPPPVRPTVGGAAKRSAVSRAPSRDRIRHHRVTAPARPGRPGLGEALLVLFVGAERGTGLDLRGQLRLTKAAIQRARFGRSVAIAGVFNVTLDRMLMELHGRSPAILHLSGKQDDGQVKMHNKRGDLVPVSADRLAALLARSHTMLQLVILDTCRSLSQARLITSTVNFAIGVAGDIAEPVAINFFAMFYNALANGASVKRAFDLAWGLESAKLDGDRAYRREFEDIVETDFDPDQHLPRLVSRKGLNPDRMVLVPTPPR